MAANHAAAQAAQTSTPYLYNAAADLIERNLAVRPELSIVLFDTHVAPADAAALYLSATAAEADDGIEVYSAHSVAQGLPAYTAGDLTEFRLYRARVLERWLLAPGSHRIEH